MPGSRGEASWMPTRRASATCSRRVYRVVASDRDLLTKNIGFCFRFSSPLNKVALTETSETTRYK